MNFLQHVCNLKIVHIATFQVAQKQRTGFFIKQLLHKEEKKILFFKQQRIKNYMFHKQLLYREETSNFSSSNCCLEKKQAIYYPSNYCTEKKQMIFPQVTIAQRKNKSNFFFKQQKRKIYLFFQQLLQRRNEQFLLQQVSHREETSKMTINMYFESKCALNQNVL